ncbi:MAG: ABC transporter permease, partial [Geobacteraceae bacterium]|nr:ABC transporter permease [Geobacteraceae bacterium]
MFERLKAMLVKEFTQVLRDPRMRFVIFVIPVFQTVVFGYAVNTDVKHAATAVYDLDSSRESRELVAQFVKSGYFDVKEYVSREGRVRELVDRSEVKAVLRINHGFGERLRAGRPATVQIILDGTDSNTAGILLSYASRIAARFSDRQQTGRLARKGGIPARPGGVELQSRSWFNENLESRNFYVPAVI